MNIKHRIKEVPFLNRTNAIVKARIQEKKAAAEVVYYCRKASEGGMKLPESELLAQSVRQRLEQRGINLTPKHKGDLHIFLAFGLSNWESVLPIALAPFGRVTTFSWQSGGFFRRSEDWLKWRESLNSEMLSAFKKAQAEQPVDVMIGYLSDFNTKKDTLLEIGRNGVIIFNFCWDDKLYFNGSLKRIVSAVDLNLTNAPDSVFKYMVEGGLAMFWPEAAHPDVHKPYDLPFEYDVSFVGGKYGWRPRFIKKLRKMGIEVTCFGNGWENGPLSEEEMVKLYSRSRINLGFAGVGHSKKLMCLKGRDFEVPMSGGLYLTQNNPELLLVYDVGKEIMTYRDEKDCTEKIKWLLENPDEADKIRKAGRMRALKDHTWEKRFSDVFKIAGLL